MRCLLLTLANAFLLPFITASDAKKFLNSDRVPRAREKDDEREHGWLAHEEDNGEEEEDDDEGFHSSNFYRDLRKCGLCHYLVDVRRQGRTNK